MCLPSVTSGLRQAAQQRAGCEVTYRHGAGNSHRRNPGFFSLSLFSEISFSQLSVNALFTRKIHEKRDSPAYRRGSQPRAGPSRPHSRRPEPFESPAARSRPVFFFPARFCSAWSHPPAEQRAFQPGELGPGSTSRSKPLRSCGANLTSAPSSPSGAVRVGPRPQARLHGYL